jgi:hypothetical protein
VPWAEKCSLDGSVGTCGQVEHLATTLIRSRPGRRARSDRAFVHPGIGATTSSISSRSKGKPRSPAAAGRTEPTRKRILPQPRLVLAVWRILLARCIAPALTWTNPKPIMWSARSLSKAGNRCRSAASTSSRIGRGMIHRYPRPKRN